MLTQSLQTRALWERLLAAIRAGDGAPTPLRQNLTSSEFQNQCEISISSCNSCGENRFPAEIYATTGLPEYGADEQWYPLSQKPLVTFVPFVVKERS